MRNKQVWTDVLYKCVQLIKRASQSAKLDSMSEVMTLLQELKDKLGSPEQKDIGVRQYVGDMKKAADALQNTLSALQDERNQLDAEV